jgi:hypothetical protein
MARRHNTLFDRWNEDLDVFAPIRNGFLRAFRKIASFFNLT